jgi:hypothetical protein
MYCPGKDAYGYNAQAVCDHECHFTFVDYSNYTAVHDDRAFRETHLWTALEEGLLTLGG